MPRKTRNELLIDAAHERARADRLEVLLLGMCIAQKIPAAYEQYRERIERDVAELLESHSVDEIVVRVIDLYWFEGGDKRDLPEEAR